MNFTQLQIFVQVNVQQTRVVTFMLKCSQRFKSTRTMCVEFQIRNIYLVLSLKQRWAERLYADGPVRLWGRQHHVKKIKTIIDQMWQVFIDRFKTNFYTLDPFLLESGTKWWYVVSISCYEPVLEIRSLTDITTATEFSKWSDQNMMEQLSNTNQLMSQSHLSLCPVLAVKWV